MALIKAKKNGQLGNKVLTNVFSILLGMVMGCFYSTLNRSSLNVLSSSASQRQQQQQQRSNDDDSFDYSKMKRYWKYSQTYRYILPASRYDYVPLPIKECGSSPDFVPWFQQNYEKRSRKDEDKFIYETFFKDHHSNNFTTGTYVELGAFNGNQESNTRFFDECLGWKGLLIEGNPENYEKTITNRPYAHKMSLAPSCSAEFEAVNKTIPFYRYPMTNAGLVNHAKTYEGKPTVDVPCGPLSPILIDIFSNNNNNNIDDGRSLAVNNENNENNNNNNGETLPTVDFFSLDVEGAEVLVLSTIQFQAVRINILMIEVKNNHCKDDGCEVRKQVRAKMASEGYKRYEGLVHASDIYVHPESPFQIPESIAKPNV